MTREGCLAGIRLHEFALRTMEGHEAQLQGQTCSFFSASKIGGLFSYVYYCLFPPLRPTVSSTKAGIFVLFMLIALAPGTYSKHSINERIRWMKVEFGMPVGG